MEKGCLYKVSVKQNFNVNAGNCAGIQDLPDRSTVMAMIF
jgi:hypothetical protein